MRFQDMDASANGDFPGKTDRADSSVVPFLDIGIVSYECRDLLSRCLESLREHAPRRPMHVVVVDNGSTDGTPELVRARFPEVELVEAGANLGFARATNV